MRTVPFLVVLLLAGCLAPSGPIAPPIEPATGSAIPSVAPVASVPTSSAPTGLELGTVSVVPVTSCKGELWWRVPGVWAKAQEDAPTGAHFEDDWSTRAEAPMGHWSFPRANTTFWDLTIRDVRLESRFPASGVDVSMYQGRLFVTVDGVNRSMEVVREVMADTLARLASDPAEPAAAVARMRLAQRVPASSTHWGANVTGPFRLEEAFADAYDAHQKAMGPELRYVGGRYDGPRMNPNLLSYEFEGLQGHESWTMAVPTRFSSTANEGVTGVSLAVAQDDLVVFRAFDPLNETMYREVLERESAKLGIPPPCTATTEPPLDPRCACRQRGW